MPSNSDVEKIDRALEQAQRQEREEQRADLRRQAELDERIIQTLRAAQPGQPGL
jgi:hypothetical protein